MIIRLCLALAILGAGFPQDADRPAKPEPPRIKVAVQYRWLTDGGRIGRSLDDAVRLLAELKPDLVFQGWLTQWPLPEKTADLPTKALQREAERQGYSREHLADAVARVKAVLPDAIFGGGVQAEYLFPDEVEGKDDSERRDRAWAMSLNPAKWGLSMSRTEMQAYWARRWGILGPDDPVPAEDELKRKMRHFFPDLSDPDFQKVFLRRILPQIDAGAGAMWIDMLYVQPYFLLKLANIDENHRAFQESLAAAETIVDRIHDHGLKQGRRVLVITWVSGLDGDNFTLVPRTNVDMAMVSPRANEIRDKRTGRIARFNEKLWDEELRLIKERLGIPVLVRIDYGGIGRSPLNVFSQELSPEEAAQFLKEADEFFSSRGANLIYPLHGGDMGPRDKVSKLAYGKLNWYDAVAPEFGTYAAIKELAARKGGQEPGESKQSLAGVRVGVLYENVTDGVSLERSKADTIRLLKETRADLVLRAFWKWAPVVDAPDRIPPELLSLAEGKQDPAEGLRRSGHYYEALRDWIAAIKAELPSIVVCGAIPAQTLYRIEWNPVTGKVYGSDETWQMSLDPQKWKIERDGKPLTRERFQEWFYGVHPYGGKAEKEYDRKTVPGYFPDITNPDFQDLFVSWAKKQIDCGADAIWIDMLYHQSARLAQMTKDVNHAAVRESAEAAAKLVQQIRDYGKVKGRRVFVGSWDGPFGRWDVAFPYAPPALDFVTVSPSVKEVVDGKLDGNRWTKQMDAIRKAYGDVPVFAYIDWGFDESPTVAFSQKLDPEGQREVLRRFDRSFREAGINFIYPLHGGYLGRGEATTKLSFGKWRIYDSLAPEFGTYETIRELARKKAEGEKP